MTKSIPFFSVVLPTYNRVEFIAATIESVVKQKYDNWELIVVNDCSTDKTSEVIGKYASKKIKILNLAENNGVSYARNRALEIAKGRFVTFLDDDDLYAPSFLQTVHDRIIADNHSYDFYWTGIGILQGSADDGIKVESEVVWKANSRVKDDKGLLLKKIAISHGMVIKTQSLNKVGLFDEDFVNSEDKDLILRMIKKGLSYKSIASAQVYKRQHDYPQLSHNSDNFIRVESAERMIKKHADYLSQNRKLLLALQQSLARKYFRAGMSDKGRVLMRRLCMEKWDMRILLKWIKLEMKYFNSR